MRGQMPRMSNACATSFITTQPPKVGEKNIQVMMPSKVESATASSAPTPTVSDLAVQNSLNATPSSPSTSTGVIVKFARISEIVTKSLMAETDMRIVPCLFDSLNCCVQHTQGFGFVGMWSIVTLRPRSLGDLQYIFTVIYNTCNTK